MTWVRLDDQLHAHPKVRRAWRACPASVGLHALALSYCGAYLTDGDVPDDFVADQLPDEAAAAAATSALEAAGLWERNGDGWRVHDYLDLNPSRADVERERAAKRKAGKKGGRASGRARRKPA